MEGQNDNNTSNRSFAGLFRSARDQISQIESPIMESTADKLRGARDWFNHYTFGSSNRLANTERELEETRRELEEKRTRLSAINSSRIRDNLGDQFHPNKLGEMSSELYDNEWTDAFEELVRKGYTETESIRIFLDIIMKIAHSLTAGCRDDKLRPLVSDPGPVRVYVDACVKLCLLMVLHDPLLVWKCPQWSPDRFLAQTRYADVNDEEGLPEQKNDNVATSMQWEETGDCVGGSKAIHFHTSLFKPYTAAGDYIEYIVWPAMLLYENGPILRRGVAQGFQKKASSETASVNVPTLVE